MIDLPKFYTDNSMSPDNPFHEASEAWNDFLSRYKRDSVGLQKLLSAATDDMIFRPHSAGETYDSKANFMAITIEENLREDFPDFYLVADGLKRAIDKLKGKAITWNHYQRGQVIGEELTDFDPTSDTYVYTLKRAMATFPEETGFLIDHHIGPNAPLAATLGGYPVMLEVGYEPSTDRGLIMSLDEMFAIRETVDSSDSGRDKE